jgi:hypothetical protein
MPKRAAGFKGVFRKSDDAVHDVFRTPPAARLDADD